MTEALFDDLGRSWRDAGVALADAHERAEWKAEADRAIGYLAAVGEPFTAEDVRALVGDPDHPNAFGARFLAAARAGRILKIGYRPSMRPELHAHPIGLWIGKGGVVQ